MSYLHFISYKESPTIDEIFRRIATRYKKRQRDIENRERRRIQTATNT